MRAGGIEFSCSALEKKRKELRAGKKRKDGSTLVGSIARKKTSARVGLESRSRSHALKKGMSRSGASG